MDTERYISRIESIEAARAKAIIEADFDMLDHITDEDYVHVESSGTVRTKGEFLDQIKNGSGRYERYLVLENNIRIYGYVAVVTGVFENSYRARDGDCINKRARHIRVYVCREARWRNVSHQATSLA
jgi:hypothetical protein